ncbi:ATP-binding cassette domain-containing protein [Streptomyces sp. DSM 44915]|uniref:ATP-binding cassette domain-containing protein n=1 Tax=Streptomyces chisholmiae TaxID=3075540 RepID=A0ABU2JZK2_9ACTN|nr:ATP-binding cassette domain-containing protein [Streptomyces sp. DSM 44915]MDT0270415.1 ATP-binding cassette domain-containing protein [Streptomyces sp. DSM 44915]
MTATAISAEGIRKRYGDTQALDGFDLTVAEGTVHGLLGPNGAGKTTAVRTLATLSRITEGRATVCGFDVAGQPDEVRARIGLTGQYAAVDETLSGRQNLVLFGRLFGLRGGRARRRADELLTQFALTDAAGRSAGDYSGGMRRRLDLAASMIVVPRVLFLDEPTTGLDPRSRNQVWDAVRSLVAGGTTVLLTTQYLEEADQLADLISVMDAGRVVAEGTADELKARLGGDRIEVVARDVTELPDTAALVRRVCDIEPEVNYETCQVVARVNDRVLALTEVAAALRATGLEVTDLGTRRPSLDEVFLHLTDRPAGERAARRQPTRKEGSAA